MYQWTSKTTQASEPWWGAGLFAWLVALLGFKAHDSTCPHVALGFVLGFLSSRVSHHLTRPKAGRLNVETQKETENNSR